MLTRNICGCAIAGWCLVILLQGAACTKTYSTFTDTASAPTQASQSLTDYLKNNYSFSIFYAGLQRVGLDKQIMAGGKFTLLVPDNDAFARDTITLDSVMSMDTAALRQWLGFHIVQGAIAYDSVPQTINNVYFTILGQKIFFSRPLPSRNNNANSTQTMHIDGVAVNNFDIRASNGFIQVLNTPLNAPLQGTLQDYINAHLDEYSLFKQALQHFNLWNELVADTGSQLTVFAPVNAAFANIGIYWQGQNLIYTITPDTIAAWDTTIIPKAVFEAYLLPSRIFTSDFTDAPASSGANGVYASYILPDGSAAVSLGLGQPTITAQLLGPYALQVKGSSTATIIPPGNYATVSGNNVLQPIDQVLIVP